MRHDILFSFSASSLLFSPLLSSSLLFSKGRALSDEEKDVLRDMCMRREAFLEEQQQALLGGGAGGGGKRQYQSGNSDSFTLSGLSGGRSHTIGI